MGEEKNLLNENKSQPQKCKFSGQFFDQLSASDDQILTTKQCVTCLVMDKETNNLVFDNYFDLVPGLFRWKGGICCYRSTTKLQSCALPRGTCTICQACRSLHDTGPSRKAPGAPPPTCRCGLLCYDSQPVRTGQTCQAAGKPGNIFSVSSNNHTDNNRICVY